MDLKVSHTSGIDDVEQAACYICPPHITSGPVCNTEPSLAFHSILFPGQVDANIYPVQVSPNYLRDLNLDQIIDAVIGKDEYALRQLFYSPLDTLDKVLYRQEVMREIESSPVRADIEFFSSSMRVMREQLAQAEKLYYKLQKERYFLTAVEMYCESLVCFEKSLSAYLFTSRGLRRIQAYLNSYVASVQFVTLKTEAGRLASKLSSIEYNLLIKDDQVAVRHYAAEVDFSVLIDRTFARFRQKDVKDYKSKFIESPNMDHVEAGILERVAKLFPDVFLELENYCIKNHHYQDELVVNFDREVQFYMSYLAYLSPLKLAGLSFCYPKILTNSKEVNAIGFFDLALAKKLVRNDISVVGNDFYLKENERVLVVSGPNQGGKTTFARAFGQAHHLAALGCSVPGVQAELYLSDKIFALFEREEDVKNLRGKLQDDLVRAREILKAATSKSIIIINEIFSSTTASDAEFLGRKIMERILGLDVICVCVTFIHELSFISDSTVSMLSTVDEDDPSKRTFKIVRRPVERFMYALAIAKKHRLTYDLLKERIPS
ncbi:DNA mismatch repair protein MutS [Pseudomonas sp. AO-1]|uniref:MutS-related protein n=1 Tax=Pseudomonas sp. AO-1 TaxID=2855434 RepID=UPI001C789435|nr:DNA mismatch repair protein MutS [Pseudomonas sp. AO-1]QXZ14648.1 DNA mismatch repair protein MutS [Pseudomonas sp. AO-1]